ncbi:M23 family metallopeptidase [Flavobacterium sp.]|uniref:M23 family metallopeptidase n=1 Tax=Flavobacterium sp. TaxID=239 RepID=UPI002634EE3D|nr:M23 family metallopeptidase [Flavobacterium sp.]
MKYIPLFLLFSIFSSAQNNYPNDYFRSPLDIPLQLSGNFGELRPNHFHAGFDFKTNQKEGLNVYAVGDGYVSRIKISTSGYGKAIYITHANGYTSVYGHLQKAVGFLQDKIIALQYAEKNYEIEAFFKPGELVVKKGDIIALSGNTGGSEGPHLHFEFRDNKTEKIINPLFFGIQTKDTKNPIVSSLLAYPIDKNSVVNESKRPVILSLSLQPDGTYLSQPVLASGKIGFGISAYDTDNVSYNPNGVYKTQLMSNGKVIFGYEFDAMVFDEARYINTFIDYNRYKKTRQRVQKLFMKNAYPFSNIYQNYENGILNITPNTLEVQRIEVSDFFNNKTIITIPVKYSVKPALVQEEQKVTKYFVKSKVESNFEKDNFSVYIPAGTFYEDFYMNFDVRNNTLFLHDDTVPAHSNFTISIEDNKSSEEEKKKMFIASTNGSKLGYITTKLSGNTFSCKARTLGQFTLAKDTAAPKISMAKSIEGKWITNQKSISVNISDDLSGIKTYNGYLNDKWVLFEYESKLKRLTHVFSDDLLQEGANKLKIVVTDNVGNSTIFETQFNRSQKK